MHNSDLRCLDDDLFSAQTTWYVKSKSLLDERQRRKALGEGMALYQ